MKRLALLSLVLASALVVTIAAGIKFNNRTTGMFIYDSGVGFDMTTSGATPAYDMEDAVGCSWTVRVATMTGGSSPTVDHVAETSEDGSVWFPVQAFQQYVAADETGRERTTGETLLRYTRWTWTTAGSPTSVLGQLTTTCKR